METITIKRNLLKEALDQLKAAQQDRYVLSTQNVIDELEVALRQKHVIEELQHRCNCGMQHINCDCIELNKCSECGGNFR